MSPTRRAHDTRPVYCVELRPEPGVDDAVRALRAALKLLLRRFGLKAIRIEERPPLDRPL
jgi:hypothetical protein